MSEKCDLSNAALKIVDNMLWELTHGSCDYYHYYTAIDRNKDKNTDLVKKIDHQKTIVNNIERRLRRRQQESVKTGCRYYGDHFDRIKRRSESQS